MLQAELIVGDQSGVIHIWDLKTDHNEQLIPEPDVAINSVHIDPDASYMAAVNSSVSGLGGLMESDRKLPCTSSVTMHYMHGCLLSMCGAMVLVTQSDAASVTRSDRPDSLWA